MIGGHSAIIQINRATTRDESFFYFRPVSYSCRKLCTLETTPADLCNGSREFPGWHSECIGDDGQCAGYGGDVQLQDSADHLGLNVSMKRLRTPAKASNYNTFVHAKCSKNCFLLNFARA